MPYNLKLDYRLPDNYKLEKLFVDDWLDSVIYDDSSLLKWYTIWNKSIDNNNFSKAKKKLEKEVYNWVDLALRTFYCGCDYKWKTNKVDHKSCWLEHDWRYTERYKKIEWEHVVPAQAYLWDFPEWNIWHDKCVSSKWKAYKWRKCLEKVSKTGKYMISDMHNLYPVTWNLNALRSNYPVWEIPWEKRLFWLCNIEIENKTMEPKDNIRWDIARIYKYMHYTYPEYNVTPEYMNLLKQWSKMDPISEEECERYSIILKTQKSVNIVLHKHCYTRFPKYFL